MLKKPKRQSSPRGKNSPRGKVAQEASPRGKVAQEASPRGRIAEEANSLRGRVSIWPKKAKQYSGIVEADDVDET
jgi:hypothetical protein